MLWLIAKPPKYDIIRSSLLHGSFTIYKGHGEHHMKLKWILFLAIDDTSSEYHNNPSVKDMNIRDWKVFILCGSDWIREMPLNAI